MDSAQSPTESHFITREPYYEPVGNEVTLFESAHPNRLPVLLKGPTGCGKPRFMEYMAWRLKRPLITASCHDDLTTSDLVGRYLVKGGETTWIDGPLTRAVRLGGICYLDEIVFVAPSFDYPKPELEAKIIRHETGLDEAATAKLLKLAEMTRNLKGNGIEEGASTRLPVHAGKLIAQGVEPRAACQGALALASPTMTT